MKKLRYLVGGQPFRSTDFEVIESSVAALAAQAFGMVSAAAFIVSGADNNIPELGTPHEEFTIPDGYIFDGSELCRVIGATLEFDDTKSVFLRPETLLTSPRTVNGAQQEVFTEKVYNVVYTVSQAQGDLVYLDLPRVNLLTSDKYAMESKGVANLGSGFTGAKGVTVYGNDAGDVLLECKFTSTVGTQGNLCTLALENRPAINVTGFYRSGNSIMPVTIKTNGEVEVYGPSSSQSNFLYFQFNVNTGA